MIEDNRSYSVDYLYLCLTCDVQAIAFHYCQVTRLDVTRIAGHITSDWMVGCHAITAGMRVE